jgi:hypothetical protein
MTRCADTACRRWRLFGALQFNGSWYCSRACVEQAALAGLGEPEPEIRPAGMSRSLPPLKLGVLLRHAGVITQAQLEAALAAKAGTGFRIGKQLEEMGFAAPEAVLRALATQAGVSYLANFDIARVASAPGALPPAMVRALGLVPFEIDAIGQRLHVITAAPVPRTAIRAITKLIGWNVEVYLVTDSVFEAALDAYEPIAQTPVGDAHMVRSLDAAAARVAERAERDRAVTMRHVTCDDYVWVRLEGPEHISDLLIGKGESRGPLVATKYQSQRGLDRDSPAARTSLDPARDALSESRRAERPAVVHEGDSQRCQVAYTAH